MTELSNAPDPLPTAPEESRWLSRGVLGVGTASFFSDAGHEIATSVLPSFLTVTLHAGPGALGAIEGTSDALVGLSKLAGGPLSNDPERRARLATGGYLGTALATGAIGLAVAVWQVAVLRALAWASRGIRSPARDTLLTSLVPPQAYGRAFGVERAGDNAGAIVGPLLASVLVAVVGIRHAIWFAVIPGVLAAVAITVAAREARRTVTSTAGRRTLSLNLGELRRAGLARALAPAALFEFGNIATTLLILRATGLLHTGGRSLAGATSLAILLRGPQRGCDPGGARRGPPRRPPGSASSLRRRRIGVRARLRPARGGPARVAGAPVRFRARGCRHRLRGDSRVHSCRPDAARSAPRQRFRRPRTGPVAGRSCLVACRRVALGCLLRNGRLRVRRRLDARLRCLLPTTATDTSQSLAIIGRCR